MRVILWSTVITLHAGFLCLLFLSGAADVTLDASEYWALGSLYSDGDILWQESPIAYRTPAYPAFLGFMQSVAGERAWQLTIAIQHLLLLVSAAAVAWGVHRLTRQHVWSVAAYVVTAAGLIRTWYAQTVLTETLFTTMVTLHMLCLLICLQRVSVRNCLLVGLTLGLAILIRPVVQLWWLPAFGLITISGVGETFRGRLLRSLVGLTVMGAIVAPWFMRNHLVFGEPFLTQFLGRNLWVVTFHPGSDANDLQPDDKWTDRLLQQTGWQPDDPRLQDTWKVSDRLTSTGMADDEADRLMKQVCIAAIRDNPVSYAGATARRFVNFWRCVSGPYPYLGDLRGDPPPGQIGWYSETLTRWESLLYQGVLQRHLRWNELFAVCACVGTLALIRHRRSRNFGIALLLFFGMIAGLTALVEVPTVRYRLILEPLMLLAICGGGAVLLGDQEAMGNETAG